MNIPRLPLNGLRAFEASARHLSLTRAAKELHVTPSALSHQIQALEEALGHKLFERKVRAIALTPAGKLLFPGLQAGFTHIRNAVESLTPQGDDRVIVISTPPGFTAKWLAPRLYRFSKANPEIDARVSSSLVNADFTTDGVDVAVRNLASDHVPGTDGLATEKLIDIALVPVMSPKLADGAEAADLEKLLQTLPLIHDESLPGRIRMPDWSDWLRIAGIDGVNVERGLRFNSADHALDAAIEGAGILLSHSTLAHDDLKTGRLVQLSPLTLPTGRAYHLVYPQTAAQQKKIIAFHAWIKAELAAMDGL